MAPVLAPGNPAGVLSATNSVEGLVKAKLGRRARPAPGLSIYLVPVAAGAALVSGAEETNPDFAVLQEKMADLDRQARRAMQDDSFMVATAEHDRLREEQETVGKQIADILAAHHGRHAMLARDQSIAGTTTDVRGWYAFNGIPPGDYMVYARLVKDDADVEWVLRTHVADQVSRVDLNSSNARDQFKN